MSWAIPMGPQVAQDPRENPRWSEKEGRILTLKEHKHTSDIDLKEAA